MDMFIEKYSKNKLTLKETKLIKKTKNIPVVSVS